MSETRDELLRLHEAAANAREDFVRGEVHSSAYLVKEAAFIAALDRAFTPSEAEVDKAAMAVARVRFPNESDDSFSETDLEIARAAIAALDRAFPAAGGDSHLGPTCDKRGRKHIWHTTEHGHDICVDCKVTRLIPSGDGMEP